MDNKSKNLIPLNIAVRKYKLPRKWLIAEVKAGRLPGLIAENSILFDESILTDELLKRAQGERADNGRQSRRTIIMSGGEGR